MRAFSALLAAASCLLAQHTVPPSLDRYEVGLRLREFERALGAAEAGPARTAALAELDQAVRAFFRLDLAQVARHLDEASWALRGRPPEPGERWAAALQFTATPRLVGDDAEAVEILVTPAYSEAEAPPEAARVEVGLVGSSEPLVSRPWHAAVSLSLPLRNLPIEDLQLRCRVRHGASALVDRPVLVSRAANLAARLASIQSATEAAAAEASALQLERSCLTGIDALLRSMQRQKREETVLPANHLLAEAEALATAIHSGTPHYTAQRRGSFWLWVPLGRATLPVRWYAPATVAADEPRPLVVALHGAGGSENLFFDGYGDGAIVTLARQRGWFLVAPRLGMLGGPDLAGLVDALAERWPIDRQRVAIVGHSMGAAAAVAAVVRHPARYAAAAALGGGGSVPNGADVGKLRWYVAAGERDFGRPGATALHQRLLAAGASSTYRELPGVEHLSIVQFALPEVFEHFAAAFAAR